MEQDVISLGGRCGHVGPVCCRSRRVANQRQEQRCTTTVCLLVIFLYHVENRENRVNSGNLRIIEADLLDTDRL